MAACRDCGAEVRWAQTGSGRFLPPLEAYERITADDKLWVIDSETNQAVEVKYLTLFRMHACDEAERERYQTILSEEERRRNEYQAALEAAVTMALGHDCKRCGAVASVMCWNLADRRNGKPERHTRWPHDERGAWRKQAEAGLLAQQGRTE